MQADFDVGLLGADELSKLRISVRTPGLPVEMSTPIPPVATEMTNKRFYPGKIERTYRWRFTIIPAGMHNSSVGCLDKLGTWSQAQIWALISLEASETHAHSRFLPLLRETADKSKISANSLIIQLNVYLVEL